MASDQPVTASTSTTSPPQIIPYEDRTYDLLIYGATGFTGQHLCRYLTTRIATSPDDSSLSTLKWVISGRNQTKLERLRTELTTLYTTKSPTNPPQSQPADNAPPSNPLTTLPILTADVTDLQSLQRVISQSKLVISCVGPYRFFGENVVRVCATVGTHYIDICGEPDFMERCAYNYYNQALLSNSIIVSACGFDSIPSDIGALHLNNLYILRGGICSNIEVYINLSAPQGYPAHVTTFEAAVHGFGNSNELRKLRKDVDSLDENKKWKDGRKNVIRIGPKLKANKDIFFWSDRAEKWSMIFPFADSAVVNNSQGILSRLVKSNNNNNNNNENDSEIDRINSYPQFGAYMCFNSKMAAYQAVAIGGVGTLLTRWEWGRNLLLNYPETMTLGSFTHAGPTQEQMESTSFNSRFFGVGYKRETVEKVRNDIENNENENKDEEKGQDSKENMSISDRVVLALKDIKPDLNIETSVTGGDPGYGATALMSVETALCLINDLELIRNGNKQLGIPGIKGGVFTPGAVFGASNLVERLNKAGIKFNVINDPEATQNVNNNNNVNNTVTTQSNEEKKQDD